MSSPISRILLPVTVDSQFNSACDFALDLAEEAGAGVTLLVIEDDSEPWETVRLPFHEKTFVHNPMETEDLPPGSLGEHSSCCFRKAMDQSLPLQEVLVRGHSATQILLLSRFHDLIVIPANPVFFEAKGAGERRVRPVYELLDQTVVPVITVAPGTEKIGSAAVYFDGGPGATRALHALVSVLAHQFEIPIHVRVSRIEESDARILLDQCHDYIRSKGFTNVIREYSSLSPVEAVEKGEFGPVDLSALGTRSRHSYHDLHLGILAQHFLDDENAGNLLFC